jgi:hypothetical protein
MQKPTRWVHYIHGQIAAESVIHPLQEEKRISFALSGLMLGREILNPQQKIKLLSLYMGASASFQLYSSLAFEVSSF